MDPFAYTMPLNLNQKERSEERRDERNMYREHFNTLFCLIWILLCVRCARTHTMIFDKNQRVKTDVVILLYWYRRIYSDLLVHCHVKCISCFVFVCHCFQRADMKTLTLPSTFEPMVKTDMHAYEWIHFWSILYDCGAFLQWKSTRQFARESFITKLMMWNWPNRNI